MIVSVILPVLFYILLHRKSMSWTSFIAYNTLLVFSVFIALVIIGVIIRDLIS